MQSLGARTMQSVMIELLYERHLSRVSLCRHALLIRALHVASLGHSRCRREEVDTSSRGRATLRYYV